MPGFPNISLNPTKVPLYTLMRPIIIIDNNDRNAHCYGMFLPF